MTRCIVQPSDTVTSSRRARRGGSLIEVLIASVLLTTAIAALLGTTKKVAEQMGTSRKQMVAASVAQARMDSLGSISCAALTAASSGQRTTRGIREAWTVTDGTNTKLLTLTLIIPGLTKEVVYRTIIPCV